MPQSLSNLTLFPGEPRRPRQLAAPSQAKSDQLWVAIRLPGLILDVLQATRQQPVLAVTEPGASRIVIDPATTCVVAADPQAAALGIRIGAGLNEALAICGDLQVLHRCRRTEAERLRSLAMWLRMFSPDVVIASANELLLEVRSSLRLFGGLQKIIVAISHYLAELPLRACISHAPAARGALWLARTCELSGQAAAGVLTFATLESALRNAPMVVTGWSDKELTRLDSMGIRRVGDLLRLPRDGFARRFGRERQQDLDAALGRRFEPQRTERFDEPLEWEVELPAETADNALILEAAELLFAEAVSALRQRQKQLLRFALCLGHLQREATIEYFELLHPSDDRQRLADLVFHRLERSALPAPVVDIELRVLKLREIKITQPELFDTGNHAHHERTAGVMERLRERLGVDAVYAMELVADHRPEAAWKRKDYACPLRQADGVEIHLLSPWAGERPLWLLDAPRPVRKEQFSISSGPERVEGGWWDRVDISRDYYHARRRSGEHCWVYFDRRAESWFLHGLFG